ncbi:hypothetical protein HDV00_003033 [Rhizophlyctis rosea]|nr:hypothetical protein HDV00_003033 [Rhizophlyctis rosea]
MISKISIFALVASVGAANAHYFLQSVNGDGTCLRDMVSNGGPPQWSNSPISGAAVSSSQIMCNIQGSSSPAASTCTFAAGSEVKTVWYDQPGEAQQNIYHPGPCAVYASSDNGASWAKIWGHEIPVAKTAGAYGSYTDDAWSWCNNFENGGFTFIIPPQLPSGKYIFRAEHVGLQVTGAAQFYVRCFDVQITGGGSTPPSPTVAFPGAYSANDAGATFAI